MTTPVRIQLSRAKGWRMPPNTVKVDRSTRWGNKWRVVAGGKFLDDGAQAWAGRHDWEINYPVFRSKVEAAQRSVDEFKSALLSGTLQGFADLSALRGKNLACWCKPGDPCHADVLLELANAAPIPHAHQASLNWERSCMR